MTLTIHLQIELRFLLLRQLYLLNLPPTMPRSQRGAGGGRGVGRGIANSNGGGRTRYNILLSISILGQAMCICKSMQDYSLISFC